MRPSLRPARNPGGKPCCIARVLRNLRHRRGRNISDMVGICGMPIALMAPRAGPGPLHSIEPSRSSASGAMACLLLNVAMQASALLKASQVTMAYLGLITAGYMGKEKDVFDK
jgi:hypothetical protein